MEEGVTLEKKMVRVTPQRKVILEELQKVDTHPTADELYELVRKRMPKISLGTIYRNLDLLSNQNVIQKLHVHEGQMRFDGNAHPHLHIYCVNCGRVADVHSDNDLPDLTGKIKTDFAVQGCELIFYGLCPACAQ